MPHRKRLQQAHAEVEVINDWGLHARPAAAIASAAGEFDSEVNLAHDSQTAPALSVASLLMLEAGKGSRLAVTAQGADAHDAVQAIVSLFENGFGEDHKVIGGQGTHCGIVIGAAHVLLSEPDDIVHYSIAKASVKDEIRRLNKALGEVRKEFKQLEETCDDPHVHEFQTLLLAMLEEKHFNSQPRAYITEHSVNAEWALKVCVDELLAEFKKRADPVWDTRAEEYSQLLLRVTKKLNKVKSASSRRIKPGSKRIVVVYKLGPADVIEYHRAGYAGIVASGGSANSHAAILARGLGIPALVAVDNYALTEIDEDTRLALDSDSAELHVKPGKAALVKLRERAKAATDKAKPAKTPRIGAPPRTISRDGIRLQMLGNIEFIREMDAALRTGVEGIGLFRTEFLFMQSDKLPSEDQQYRMYREVVERMQGLEVTIRTLDLGHDKSYPGLSISPTALGFRGIRVSLREPEMFKEQLRALLRASKHGNLKIMLPFIGSVQQVTESLQLAREAAFELGWSDTPLPDIGVMLELPGTVFIMEALARHSRFFSIGSNDLLQYTLAIDRNEAGIAALADPCHPGFLALLSMIISNAGKTNLPLTLCGELASDPTMVRLCSALGLRSFSMNTNNIDEVRDSLRGFNVERSQHLAEQIVASSSPQQAEQLLQEIAS